MRKLALLLLVSPLMLYGCGSCGGATVSENQEKEEVEVETNRSIEKSSLIDSLFVEQGMGELVEVAYSGLLPAADCPGINYTLTLIHQENAESGVFELVMEYIDAQEAGENVSFYTYGRYVTTQTANLKVIELNEFESGESFFFKVVDGSTLDMLNIAGEEIESNLNYSLKRVVLK